MGRVSELGSASVLNLTDQFYLVQGAQSRKIAASVVLASLGASAGSLQVSVGNYGATGQGLDLTGATDGPAFRQAVAAATLLATSSNPAVVIVPPGRYYLNYDIASIHGKAGDYKYCVNVPSNVYIKLMDGAHISLANAQQTDTRIVDVFHSFNGENNGILGTTAWNSRIDCNTAGQTAWTGGGAKYQSETAGCPIRWIGSAAMLSTVAFKDLYIYDTYSTPINLTSNIVFSTIIYEYVYMENIITDLSADGCVITASQDVYCNNITHISRATGLVDAADPNTPSVQDGFELSGCLRVMVTNLQVIGTFSGSIFDFFGSKEVVVTGVLGYRCNDIFGFGSVNTGGDGTWCDNITISNVVVKDCLNVGSAFSVIGNASPNANCVGTIRISNMIVDGCTVPYLITGDNSIHRATVYKDLWLVNCSFLNCLQGGIVQECADRPVHFRNVQVKLSSSSTDQYAAFWGRTTNLAKSTLTIDVDGCIFDANGRPDAIDIGSASTTGLTVSGRITNSEARGFTTLPIQLTGSIVPNLSDCEIKGNTPSVTIWANTQPPTPIWYSVAELDGIANVNYNGIQGTFPGCKNHELLVRLRRRSYVNSTYRWTLTSAGRYKLETAAGGNPGLSEPNDVYFNGTKLAAGTYGSLAAGQWDWDAAGGAFTTIVVRLAGDVDPDSQGTDAITASWNANINETDSGFGGTGLRLTAGANSLTLQGYGSIFFRYDERSRHYQEQYRSLYD